MSNPKDNNVVKYKTILRDILEERPSGMRQRLSEALNKNRSFVSQLSNPNYSMPIPARHLETIFKVCLFPEDKKKEFLEAYYSAHPKRRIGKAGAEKMRKITVLVPETGNKNVDKAVEKLIQDIADRVVHTFEETL